MDSLSNRVVKGYELKECVGAGGFGQVYRAFQPSVGREVAVKVILPQHANQPDFIRRFEVEAQLIAHLEHPHIVPLYDYWRDPEGAFLVMRWLKGSLRAAIQRGPWSVEASARLLDEIAGALTVAHREGVIHRDIKPDNILLDEDDNAYLADFGIAKDLNVGSHTEEGALVGSLAYITPEQLSGETVTPRSDIYSLGLVMYESLISQKPFPSATTPAEWINVHLNEPLPHLNIQRPNLPAALNEVLQTATAKDPAHRYPNVLRFASAFRAAIPAQQRGASQPLPDALTERELDILKLMIEGLSNQEIALKLFLTTGTVKWYVNQIYTKLDVHSRHQAVQRARQLNLLGEPTSLSVISFPAKPEPIRAAPVSTPPTDFFNPYKGLRAFQEIDAHDFFGRAGLTEQLLTRLIEAGNPSQFLAVVGPSGSGKSSVVKAGLIPALRRGALPNSARWFITEMLPGTHPLEELEAALLRVAVTSLPGLLDQLAEDRRGLVRAAKRVLPADQDVELILVIDQFEELFTLLPDEAVRAHFIDNILSAVTDPRSRVRVIVTLRADFYDKPLLYPRLAELVRSHTEVVVPLTSTELEQAIAGPAERIGLQFEPGLIQTIINDVGEQPGTLPLLQYALTELFARREGVTLTLDAYKNSGGISGSLARRADELFNDLEPDGKAAARQLFLRLITLGEGTEDTRRRVLQSELNLLGNERAFDEVINAFVQYRLLTLDRDPVTRGPTVEIAHEALIREWGRLREWLTESREDLRVQRRLMSAAVDWENSKYERSFLALGTRLAQFEVLASDSDLALNANEKAYLAASIKEREQQTTDEQKRQAHEKALERRSRNVLRGLVTVLMCSTVIALALTSLAVHQGNLADRNAAVSQSLALASAAQSALTDGNTDQALTLSIAANQIELPPTYSQRILYNAAAAPSTVRRVPCPSQWCWAFDVSPDEQTMLTVSASNEIVYSDVVSGRTIRVFKGGHTDAIMTVKFLPGGKRFVSTGVDDRIILWDIPSGQIIHQFLNAAGDTNNVDVSPDGRLAAVATERGVPFLWDIETGQLIRQFVGHDPSKQVQGVAFSPDGRTLLTGSEDTTMILWDVQTGQLLRRFQGHTNVIFRVRFSPDGKFALSTSFDNTMILWDVATGQIVQRFVGHTNWVFDAQFTPDGRSILSASRDQTLGLWDVATGRLLRFFKGEAGMALSLKMLANATQAMAGYNDGMIRLWQLEDHGILRKYVQSAPPALDQFDDTLNADGNVLAVSNDGRWAVTAGAGAEAAQLWLWDVETGQLLRRFIGHKGNTTSVVFSPDQRQLLSASWDHSLILWDVQTANPIRHFEAHSQAVFDAVFSPDGKYIASASEDRSVIVWEAETASIVHRFEGFSDSANAVRFSGDGRTLIVGFGTIRNVAGDDTDNSLRLFDIGTKTELRRFTGHTAPVTTLVLGPNNVLISGSTDGTVRLWDNATGKELRRFSGHSTAVWSLALSHDGQYVTAGAQDGSIIVWNLATGDVVRQISEYNSMVYGLSFTPDDRNLFSVAPNEPMHLRRLALDLNDLVAWGKSNRYIPELTCEQRALYKLTPPCDASGVAPTAAP